MTGPVRKLTVAILFAGTIGLLTGCSNSGGSGGGATPEETFKSAQAAAEKNDYKAFMSTMTPESQETYAGMIAFGGAMVQAFAGLGGPEGAEDAKKVKEVLDKHGLTEETLKKADPTAADPIAGMKSLVEPVKDKPAFVADMMAALKSSKDFKDKSPLQKGTTLKDVKIDGDSAKGTIETEVEGKKESSPIGFKKIDGKWLIDLTETIKSSMGPPAGPA
jgi:hypothetical protein